MMASEKRLIDVDAFREFWNKNYRHQYANDTFLFALANFHTVDAVEVVHGRWIDNLDENGFLCNAWRKCSVCGGLNWSKKPNYCPNCGAKMDGDGNG